MIGSDASKDIVFDLKNWLSFEGNTGPYLMYAFSRASSLLAKSDLELNDHSVSVPKQILASEKDLLRSIHDFNRSAWTACMELKPNLLANHLYEMARAFSRFYAEAPILKEADLSSKRFRLQLTKGFAKVMFQGLDVLGMPPPKKM
jgi:arginyl-tRNA synthetase